MSTYIASGNLIADVVGDPDVFDRALEQAGQPGMRTDTIMRDLRTPGTSRNLRTVGTLIELTA